MRRFVTPLIVGAALALALVTVTRAITVSAAADRERTLTVEPLSSPAGSGSSAPQLTSEGDRTLLSWMERAGGRATLRFAERTASGWSPPRPVTAGTDLLINAADVPSVRALADGTLVAHWMQENGPDPEAYDLRLAWSRDGGTTWSKPTSPHHDGTKTQHGFASLFEVAGGGLGLVWLDGRATSADSAHATDNMSLRAAFYSKSGTELRESAIRTRVCDCCPTSVATTADGPIVAFRNRSEKEVRDIFVSRLVAGRWSTPTAVHNDGWRIEACPVNGPAVSARARDVVVAWFSAPKEEGHVFAAFSHDAGRTFGPPTRVDDVAAIGHAGVQLLKDGSAAVSWIEFANQRSHLSVRQIQADGSRSVAVPVAGAGDDRVAGTPRIAADHDGLVLAWTETRDGTSAVRTARATLR